MGLVYTNKRNWTPEDTKFVADNYKSMPASEIARRLSRTTRAVRLKSQSMGITKMPTIPKVPWSTDDYNFLEQNHGSMTCKEIAIKLGRTQRSVYAKTQLMGLYKLVRFDNHEIDYLKSSCVKITVKEIANNLNRSLRLVTRHKQLLGLSKPARSWTVAETNYVGENYGKMPVGEIAVQLGRTPYGVRGIWRKINAQRNLTAENSSHIG